MSTSPSRERTSRNKIKSRRSPTTNGDTVPSRSEKPSSTTTSTGNDSAPSSSSSNKPLLDLPDSAPFTTLHHITSYPVISDSLALVSTVANTYSPLLPAPVVTLTTHALQTASTVTSTLAPHVPLAARADALALALVSKLDPVLATPTAELARTLDPLLKPVNDRLVLHVVDKLIPPQTGGKTWADAARENVTLRQRRMGAGDAGGGGVDVNELPAGGEGEVAWEGKEGGADEGRAETQVERLWRIGGAVGGWVVGETRRREERRGVGVVRGGLGAVGAAAQKVAGW